MATISNIVIDQGTTFSLELNLTNDDNSAKNLGMNFLSNRLELCGLRGGKVRYGGPKWSARSVGGPGGQSL